MSLNGFSIPRVSVATTVLLLGILAFAGPTLSAKGGGRSPPKNVPMKIKVAAIGVATIDGKVEDNYKRALELVDEAAKDKPDLILLPEAFAAGYCADELTPYGETFDTSPYLKEFVARSQKYDCMIIMGILEKRSDGLHNVAAIIDRGEIIGRHSKSTLWPDNARPYRDERVLVGSGPGREAFDTRFGRIGILICYENMVPRAYMGFKGKADLIVSPYNCEDDPSRHNTGGCGTAGVPSIWADRTGMFYRGKTAPMQVNPGTSGLCETSGKIISKTRVGVEGIATGTLEITPRAKRDNTANITGAAGKEHTRISLRRIAGDEPEPALPAAETDGNGNFLLQHVPPGTYEVIAQTADAAGKASRPVVIKADSKVVAYEIGSISLSARK
ncbi:MAG: carbon-nitrogen hydrolase family protein [Planctomycetota bacterium]|nr:carbon-nitrogen hydrolase family protein [Planctomycetota bacterium]